jgi:hypothetical protein
MKKIVVRALPLVIAGSYLLGVRAAPVDPLLYWNGVAIAEYAKAISPAPPGTPAPLPPVRPSQIGFLDLAMVQTAVHDAVQAYEKRFHSYSGDINGAAGSPLAAIATAAHDVIVDLYSLYPWIVADVDVKYTQFLTDNGLIGDPGIAVGQQAALGIINLRVNDGRFAPGPPFTGGTAPGEWRPTESFNLPPGTFPPTPPGPPPSFAPMAVPWLATVVPFTLTSPSQFRADPQPPLTSQQYTRAYNEVKTLGSLNSTARTPDQTELAYFYAGNFLLIWNSAVTRLAAEHLDTLGDAARLFALVYLAQADALITAWDSKKFYNFWRPVTAIREGGTDGNPATIADSQWKPLINTPNYSDYTSGANNVTGAATKMLALFFKGDRMAFTVTTNYPLAVQKTRTYTHFSAAAQDVVDVRVYEGIHFRFADTAARRQGREVAKWTYKHALRPVHETHDADRDQGEDRDR